MCAFGQNRSRFLAEYLATKGFETDYDGVNNENREDVQRKIDWADIVISVSPDVHEQTMSFNISGKRIFVLDVDDRPSCVLPQGKPLDGDDWVNFQKKYVYPKLIEQVNKALKIA